MYYLFIDLPVPSDLWQVSHALFLHLFRISLFIWRVLTDFWEIRRLHPWSLACNLKINTWKRKFLLEAILFRFHVQLREGMFFFVWPTWIFLNRSGLAVNSFDAISAFPTKATDLCSYPTPSGSWAYPVGRLALERITSNVRNVEVYDGKNGICNICLP